MGGYFREGLMDVVISGPRVARSERKRIKRDMKRIKKGMMLPFDLSEPVLECPTPSKPLEAASK